MALLTPIYQPPPPKAPWHARPLAWAGGLTAPGLALALAGGAAGLLTGCALAWVLVALIHPARPY